MASEQNGYLVRIERGERSVEGEIELTAVPMEHTGKDGRIQLTALRDEDYDKIQWKVWGANIEIESDNHKATHVYIRPDGQGRVWSAQAGLLLVGADAPAAWSKTYPESTESSQPAGAIAASTSVRLTRTQQEVTRDMVLWTVIRRSTERIRFAEYSRFVHAVLCGDLEAVNDDGLRDGYRSVRKAVAPRRGLPRRALSGTDAYRALREATDWFLKVNVGVLPSDEAWRPILDSSDLPSAWNAYTVSVDGVRTLPYLGIIRDRLSDVPVGGREQHGVVECAELLRDKLAFPCFIELIWSYWQEEGMLVQTINAVANRFQNRTVGGARDPLANLEMDHLRPLNNLFWGYVQDDLNRLSVVRRAHEYEHQYGLRLEGRAVRRVRPADRRSKFLEGFHNFLHRCVRFFQQDDDTTVIADGFPVLNAIKEMHYLLAHGAHNQFGDLPSTARAEMLLQQWILARPEMREYLGGRVAVPYPEPWMDRVDAMKALRGWGDTSVVHFSDLATFGEQIVLGLRYGGWSLINDPASAANFARAWRAEIQGYIHAYRAVTGVDLGADFTSQQGTAERDLPPSVHLKRRLVRQ